jgi:hypothetical protein
MRYFRIENGFVQEVINHNPEGFYVKEIVDQFVAVNDDDVIVEPNMIYNAETGEFSVYVHVPTKDEQISDIISKLSELDKVINRTQEQLMIDNNLVCTYQKVLDVISEKCELREQLRLLKL